MPTSMGVAATMAYAPSWPPPGLGILDDAAVKQPNTLTVSDLADPKQQIRQAGGGTLAAPQRRHQPVVCSATAGESGSFPAELKLPWLEFDLGATADHLGVLR
jgi:hypothetical protein